MALDLGPTPDSIARARTAQRQEREAIFEATGIRISEAGRPVATVMGCPVSGCRYAASAINGGRATRSLANHLVRVHFWRKKES